MTLPTMTKGKHWIGLFILVVLEAFLAFIFFVFTPIGFIGLIIVILANIEWVVAAILAIKNIAKKDA